MRGFDVHAKNTLDIPHPEVIGLRKTNLLSFKLFSKTTISTLAFRILIHNRSTTAAINRPQ